MECVIAQKTIKTFVKTLQCLNKIGQVLYVEPTDDKLYFRTINETRSAFIALAISPSFFEDYAITAAEEVRNVKVSLKPCLTVFRNSNSIELCRIKIEPDLCRLVFDLMCKMGVKKTFYINFEEQKAIRPLYNNNYIDRIITRPRYLLDSVQNFHNNLEEISISFGRDSLKLKSYIDESRSDAAKILRTEMSIDTADFEDYNHEQSDVELTFCLKEVKAFLGYCDDLGQSITLNFSQAGLPILLTLKYFSIIDGTMVLATMVDNGSQQSAQKNRSPTGSASPSPSPSSPQHRHSQASQTQSGSSSRISSSQGSHSQLSSPSSLSSGIRSSLSPHASQHSHSSPSQQHVSGSSDSRSAGLIAEEDTHFLAPQVNLGGRMDDDDAGHVSGSDNEDNEDEDPAGEGKQGNSGRSQQQSDGPGDSSEDQKREDHVSSGRSVRGEEDDPSIESHLSQDRRSLSKKTSIFSAEFQQQFDND